MTDVSKFFEFEITITGLMSLSVSHITTAEARISYCTGMYSYTSACVQAYIYVTRRAPTLEEEMIKLENNKEEKPEGKV